MCPNQIPYEVLILWASGLAAYLAGRGSLAPDIKLSIYIISPSILFINVLNVVISEELLTIVLICTLSAK